MPRPKRDPDAIYCRELRITPPDGLPIEDFRENKGDFKVLIAAQEGGEGTDKRLHYHLYVETHRSESWLKTWIYSIAHCYNGESGNAVFFSRKPHDNTIGYVVKHGLIVARHGCTQTYIDEWLAKSEQYCRAKESSRKRRQRMNQVFTFELLATVRKKLAETPDLRTPHETHKLVLAEYNEAKKQYPTRSTMESLIVTLLHPYDETLVRAFYLRAFERY